MPGNRYMTIFVIEEQYVMLFLHKKKDVFEEILYKVIAQAAIRTDGATEYLDKTVSAVLLKRGIFKQTTCARQQFQDGMVDHQQQRQDCTHSSIQEHADTCLSPNYAYMNIWYSNKLQQYACIHKVQQ